MASVVVGAKIVGMDILEAKLVQVFKTWVKEDIDDAHWDDQFRDMGKWAYGRETVRKNKEVVDSPRDIYDLGALYDSGKNSTINSSDNVVIASWDWDAKNSTGNLYAYYVHEGTSTSAGFPRPWTDELYYPQKFEGSSVRLALIRRLQKAFRR